jgi:hypothetical protein
VSTAAYFEVLFLWHYNIFHLTHPGVLFLKNKTVTVQQEKETCFWTKAFCTLSSARGVKMQMQKTASFSEKFVTLLKSHYRWLLHLLSKTFRQADQPIKQLAERVR